MNPFPMRSTSAIDESAVRRARARAAIAAAMAPKNPPGAFLCKFSKLQEHALNA